MTRKEKAELDKSILATFNKHGWPTMQKRPNPVPPCRDCGSVPEGIYSLFGDGSVQCSGDSRRNCYARMDGKQT